MNHDHSLQLYRLILHGAEFVAFAWGYLKEKIFVEFTGKCVSDVAFSERVCGLDIAAIVGHPSFLSFFLSFFLLPVF
jgi:hypothetical protein